MTAGSAVASAPPISIRIRGSDQLGHQPDADRPAPNTPGPKTNQSARATFWLVGVAAVAEAAEEHPWNAHDVFVSSALPHIASEYFHSTSSWLSSPRLATLRACAFMLLTLS